jgi:hypothetical protein
MAELSANPLFLGCAFAAILGLLATTMWGELHPVFLTKPPITRHVAELPLPALKKR